MIFIIGVLFMLLGVITAWSAIREIYTEVYLDETAYYLGFAFNYPSKVKKKKKKGQMK